MLKLISKYNASRLELPLHGEFLSQVFLDMHDGMNPETFSHDVSCPAGFEPFVRLAYSAMRQDEPNVIRFDAVTRYAAQPGKKVLLGLSGGLDSVAQLVTLMNSGYNVTPFSVMNANFYTNGQENRTVRDICDRLGLDLVESSFVRCSDRNCAYHKHWSENPMKNQLILAVMADYCLENGISAMSLGDDFDLSLKDAVPGVNLTDAREMTEAFLDGLHTVAPGLAFLPMKKGFNKFDRIRLLDSAGLLDVYYSCVGPGRLNTSQHNRYSARFGVELPGRNCASCRKCCHHLLLMHYGGFRKFPDKLLERCWSKLGAVNSADYVFFRPDIPLERRIRNLFEY